MTQTEFFPRQKWLSWFFPPQCSSDGCFACHSLSELILNEAVSYNLRIPQFSLEKNLCEIHSSFHLITSIRFSCSFCNLFSMVGFTRYRLSKNNPRSFSPMSLYRSFTILFSTPYKFSLYNFTVFPWILITTLCLDEISLPIRFQETCLSGYH